MVHNLDPPIQDGKVLLSEMQIQVSRALLALDEAKY